MSTIERALEKQRQLEEQRRQESESLAAEAAVAEAAPPPPPIHSEPPPGRPQPGGPRMGGGQGPHCNIDLDRLERLGMVTPSESFSLIKEEYRYIKRPLLNNAFGEDAEKIKNANLIMVTSSYPGEGKTFTAVNLAISMALEQDRKVLLVDADVIKPHIVERLGLDKDPPGLMDYLNGEVEVSDIIHSTNIANLRLITAGRRFHHSNEMIASGKMVAFMEELSSRYGDRIVIFDSAPLLGASETNVLAQMTGQAVVVVEEEHTTHPQVERALSLLPAGMAVGLLLNKVKTGRKDYYGYYYASSR